MPDHLKANKHCGFNGVEGGLQLEIAVLYYQAMKAKAPTLTKVVQHIRTRRTSSVASMLVPAASEHPIYHAEEMKAQRTFLHLGSFYNRL